MLQIINLTKVYKSKKGADVKALDGVSLQFPETGMVFLLGKSGSGKSTLLNVCGGLDAPTAGEIIVKGRSSKDFSQGDFDSYRNTFVGFVFQEYNILNEFSVEDNIGLALELQGKSKNKARIQEILKEVDLEGLGKRKPNTLSGGQKQRIAIARALIKAPEIIMADEPTGALDSNTGKQVFETLKKLSKDKLVIVVSHDRDFAEQYGDRIIELKDGKVLSDVTKTQVSQEALTGNVNAIGDVLCVKKGSELTEDDFDKIKEFLKNSNEDVIIANNEKDVKNFKKVSRITDDGQKEVFCDSDESKMEQKQYTKEDSRFIRSKLPAKHAIKIGISSIKTKPIRLMFTVFLCTVAFVMFGLLSTMSFYDSEATFRQSMKDSGNTLMRIEKLYEVEEDFYYQGEKENTYTYAQVTSFGEDELNELKKDFGEDVFGGVPISMTLNVRSNTSEYWINRLSTMAYLPEGNTMRNTISGEYPKNKDEIVLSFYTAQVLANNGVYDAKGNAIELTEPNGIVGKTLSIGGVEYKVTGLFESGEIDPKFDSLKDEKGQADRLLYDFSVAMEDGMHLTAFVTADRLEMIAETNQVYMDDGSYYRSAAVGITKPDGTYELPEWSNASHKGYSAIPEGETYTALGSKKKGLKENEAIISKKLFYQFVSEYIAEEMDAYMEQGQEIPQYLHNVSNVANELMAGGTWDSKGKLKALTKKQEKAKFEELLSAIKELHIPMKIGLKFYDIEENIAMGELREFQVVGVMDRSQSMDGTEYVFLHDSVDEAIWNEQKDTLEFYMESKTNYKADPEAIYGTVFVPYDGSDAQTTRYWEMYKNEAYDENYSRISITGLFVENIRNVDSLVKELSKVFLYVGLVLAVFAALLLSNFVSVSISQKKREIGILRAVGARSIDVFKIFFSESFFIAAICMLLSVIGTMILCGILNAELAAGIGASLLVFGPVSLGVMLLIAFVTVIVATFLPVYNAAKKKPVDSIRSL